ncbi:ferredoxin [Candidatus Babeliales bacterium]|nr:ferredoxin [Candidatus Babeliales bacterium]
MDKNIKKVWIAPGCITCGRCEFIAPEIFEVTDVARVKNDANLSKHLLAVDQAAKTCPVQVIKLSVDDKNGQTEK